MSSLNLKDVILHDQLMLINISVHLSDVTMYVESYAETSHPLFQKGSHVSDGSSNAVHNKLTLH